MPSSFLFVYGTLMSGAAGAMGRVQRQRLKAEARVVGSGWIKGRLYDLGAYPGLVLSVEPGDIVYGEVVELSQPASSLKWLDAYEGVGPQGREEDEYSRAMASAELSEGIKLPVWVYVSRSLGRETQLIADGRWRSVG